MVRIGGDGMIFNPIVIGGTQKGINITVHGGVYEDITLSDGQVITTDANGEGIVAVEFGTITLTGSKSNKTFTETITEETTDIYCMPKNALFWHGNECTDLSGGWDVKYNGSVTSVVYTNDTDNAVSYKKPASSGYSPWEAVATLKKIDFSKYSKVKYNITYTNASIGGVCLYYDYFDSEVATGDVTSTGLKELSVSSVTNECIVAFWNQSNSTIKINEIWLE